MVGNFTYKNFPEISELTTIHYSFSVKKVVNSNVYDATL